MPSRKQSFKHSDTTYNRPNQAYVCGHACDGKSCALGPSAKGGCRAGFLTDDNRRAGECIPAKGQYNRVSGETSNKERWFCSREEVNGGTCKDGPRPDGSCCSPLTPCRPASSLRRKRGSAAILLSCLTFAFVIILLAKKPESLDHPLNPGPISSVHSSAGTTCTSCHESGVSALSSLTDIHSHRAFLDAYRCVECHQEIAGEGGLSKFSAHTLPRAHLTALTEKNSRSDVSARPSLVVALASTVSVDEGDIACASCHKEHQGIHADLKHLSDSQCQVCHTGKFHSFSEGHPEFTSYPYRRRTRIFFDHDTHFRDYFNREDYQANAKNACSDCHTEQPQGGMMDTRSFAETCAACHDKDFQIKDVESEAWKMLAFPRVDTRNLKDQLPTELAEKLADWKSARSKIISPLLSIALEEQDLKPLFPLKKASDEEKQTAVVHSKLLLEEIYGLDSAEKFAQRLLGSKFLKDADPETARLLGTNLARVFQQLQAAPTDGVELVSLPTDYGGAFTYDPAQGALYYQPSGHADPIMKAAFEVATRNVGSADHAEALLDSASSYSRGPKTTGAGKCLKCHTLDKLEDGSMRINWNPASYDHTQRPLTKFKHGSHLNLPALVGESPLASNETCVACHQLDSAKELVDSYRKVFNEENLNPHLFRSGFQHLMLSNCAECHSEKQTGDSCLLCHQYHATPTPLTPALPKLESDPAEGAKSGDGPEGDRPPDQGDGPGDSLIPGDDGDSLIPGDGESLVPGGDGESLVPDGDGESLVPDDDGESLVPDGDSESLIPDGDDSAEGDSLLPGGEDSESGESLVPEEESLLPPEDE